MIAPKELHAQDFAALGLMSGTSLDGLDLCLCKLSFDGSCWDYTLIKTLTIEYDNSLSIQLSNAIACSGAELMRLDAFYGQWIGSRVSDFLRDVNIDVDVIGSHGHTVFHVPTEGYTTQIGSGAHIAAVSGIPCVCNFRLGDVARGGQGAPLVPIGDELLFADYDICLNLGGIANISYREGGVRKAFDICPANMALNRLANLAGLPFDSSGHMGRSGEVNQGLLERLNGLPYYSLAGAKSLGREWFNDSFLPLIHNDSIALPDLLRTTYEHIAWQISLAAKGGPSSTILLSGGGAWNDFLVERIRAHTRCKVIIPSPGTVNYKEALIFALLAVLYLKRIPFCLSSSTGASRSSVGGCLFHGL